MFRKKLRKQSKQSMKEAKRELKAAAQQETMMIEKAVRDAALSDPASGAVGPLDVTGNGFAAAEAN